MMQSHSEQKLFFLIGAEGVGHHLIHDLYLRPLASNNNNPLFSSLSSCQKDFETIFENMGNEHILSILFKKIRAYLPIFIRPRLDELLKKLIYQRKLRKIDFLMDRITNRIDLNASPFIYTGSFPYGRNPRSFMHMPQISILSEICRRCNLEISLIYLTRDEEDSLQSVLRRGFGFDIIFEKAIKDATFRYISGLASGSSVARDIIHIKYEDLISAPKENIERLNRFMGIGNVHVSDQLKRVRQK